MFFLFALFVLVGCGSPSAPPPPLSPAVAASPSVDRPFLLPVVKSKVLPLPLPGQYAIALEWDGGGVFAEEWWIRRHSPAGGSQILARLPATARAFRDSSVKPVAQYEYRVLAHNEGINADIGGDTVTLWGDWVLRPGVQLWTGGRFDRLFFEKGAVLRTGGNPLKLSLLELHSDGGTIETFAEGDTAPLGQPGVPGGSISLSVGTASGEIAVFSRGQKGGEGFPGARGADGAAGEDAFAGEYHTHITAQFPPVVTRVEVQAPRSAGRGHDGARGETGGSGAGGGDAGSVECIVGKGESFWPKIHAQGGNGGGGGPGGPGGAGGPGGKGTPAGGAGKAGESGARGQVGAPGKSGGVRLELDGRVFGP